MTIDNTEFKQQLRAYSDRSLQVRSRWYSPAAIAYDQARPRYPLDLLQRGFQQANLSSQSNILEVGCGPGTATHALASLNASITAIEPNYDFYQLATGHFKNNPRINIQHQYFETFPINRLFDAVIAATSFHWISPDISYQKSAQLLKNNGHLILLWNKQLQPSLSDYNALAPIYEKHAPHLLQYEDAETQMQILESLGILITQSGYFHPPTLDSIETEMTYSSEKYCQLLNTYSPYLQLESDMRTALMAEISQKIQTDYDDQLSLSFRTAVHLAQKIEQN